VARFVLVPGAWLGAWAWRKVTPLLVEMGHEAYPVTLTGMGDRSHLASQNLTMETATQDVLNVMKYNGLDDVVMVGHSFAGKVAAAVADRAHDKVRKIVYVDALRPEMTTEPQGGFDPTREFGPSPQGGIGIPLTEEIVNRIGKDVIGSNREWMMSLATPWPIVLAKDPITLSKNYDKKKETYVFCSQSGDPVDEIIAGKWGRLNGPYKVIDSGHWPMITRPRELADAMISLAR